MSDQNFKNHARYVPLYHFIFSAIILVLLILSIINIVAGVTIQSVMFLLLAVAFIIAFITIRNFPLAVQDRAIRAEENLRYLVLTGKLLSSQLTIQQIIALRFAPDDEFIVLVDRAANEQLTPDEIKKEIKQWRAYHHRA